MAPPATAPATFINIHGRNDVYWRCEAPARAIGAKTELIDEARMNRVAWPHNTRPLRWHLEITRPDGSTILCKTKKEWEQLTRARTQFIRRRAIFPDMEGTAVWIRPCLARATLARQMQEEHGTRIVAEVDDNYIGNPRNSIWGRQTGWDDDESDLHMKGMCSMDAIVFSTALLRDIYDLDMRRRWKTWFRDVPPARRPKKPDLYVARNNVDERDWPERVERDGPIRVGWMGSPSHIWDVDLAWPALRYAGMNGAEVWMIGLNPVTDYDTVQVDGVQVRSRRSQEKIDAWKRVGFKHIPWRQPEKFERFALPLDIGLCPLVTNTTTLGKSDVKAIEYTISGAAVVAQNNAVYNRTWIHGETALLAGSPSEMIDAVALLMRDEKLRQRLVANAQQYVREERGLKQMQTEWMEAIKG